MRAFSCVQQLKSLPSKGSRWPLRRNQAKMGGARPEPHAAGRGAGRGGTVFLDGAPDQCHKRGVLGVGEVNRRHDLAGPSRTEFPGDDQSTIASPQTELASGHSINDDEQRDEPGRRENILDHCRTPNRHAPGSVRFSSAVHQNMVEEQLKLAFRLKLGS
jgi:hypothetical protein